MSETASKNDGLNNDDEIDLFELIENIWHSKVLISIITLVTLSTGLLYNFTRGAPSLEYKFSIIAHQKNDITTSIILTKLWANSTKKDLTYFSTQGMEKYQLGNNPYSPNALFIRALEKLNSLEEKTQYLNENMKKLNLNIIFPKKMSNTFEILTTTYSQTEIANLKTQTLKYIEWSLKRFDQNLIKEAKLLNGNFQSDYLSAPFYVSEVTHNLTVIDKSKSKLIIVLSILLGLITGTIIALTRNAIKTRYS